MDLYYEVAAEGTTLGDFFDRVLRGSYGHWDRTTMLQGLDRIQQIVLSNIITMQESRPRLEHDEDNTLAEAEHAFNQVRTRILNS